MIPATRAFHQTVPSGAHGFRSHRLRPLLMLCKYCRIRVSCVGRFSILHRAQKTAAVLVTSLQFVDQNGRFEAAAFVEVEPTIADHKVLLQSRPDKFWLSYGFSIVHDRIRALRFKKITSLEVCSFFKVAAVERFWEQVAYREQSRSGNR